MLPQNIEKSISHSWFGRLYLGKSNAVTLTAEGIEFSCAKGQFLGLYRKPQTAVDKVHIPWQQLTSPPVFSSSFFGTLLSFQVEGKPQQIAFLSYLAKSKFKQQVEVLWAQAHEQQLCRLIARIEATLANNYLRASLLDKMQLRIAREYMRWFPWCQSLCEPACEPLCQSLNLSTHTKAALAKLQQFYRWNKATITQLREDYIQSQLLKHADFFDHVETNPLTNKQRLACVIDDDNNLLLAGAGTGKTSVMVGRAGYLIESGKAQASEILLLAYGRKAADEMDQRIKDKLGTDDIKASTFHSLGLKVIAEAEGAQPSLSPWVDDEKAKDKWVQQTLEHLIEDVGYRKSLFEYFSQYYYVEKSPFEFESEGEYFTYLTDNDIRTLKGERVKSFGELYIANWLFSNGIEYQYEAKYEHDVSSIDFRQYQPDFYLPEYGIYIEYYGVDAAGDTAPFIDNNAYLESMAWKRQLHQQRGTTCVELFYYQHKKGQLIAELKQALSAFQVQYSPLPDEAILETLHELGRVTELAKLFSQLIGLYKAACVDDKGLEAVFKNAADPKQVRSAFNLLAPILRRYQQRLSTAGVIDFEDMIAKALSYIQAGQFISPWRYIMVDEFQDISEPRARLVRALRDSCSASSITSASLFCVGDDWQAIYRFSGADVSLTTKFTKYFGATAKTYLDRTFRFNSSIGDVASQFVSMNPQQLKKDIRSNVTVTQPAISLIQRGEHQAATIEEPSANALEQALSAITVRVGQGADGVKHKPTVYLLGRFWFHLPDSNGLRQLKLKYPSLTIECQSFHASKGKEADYVVITGMKTGKHGFPSQKVTPALLEAFLPQAEDFEFAEERRLFYVALTRAKHRVYVVADMTDVSPFVVELLQQNYAIEQQEFGTSLVQKLFGEIKCVRCTTGTLKPRKGKFSSFYSCSHFPLCDHKEEGCERCASPMTRQRFIGFKVCLNDSCGHTTPLCNVCGGDMVLRKGVRGEFWGCKNYRGNNAPSCRNAVDKSKIALPS
ncbi:UvrD-helicase domain-containing protein [Shewanella sp. KX20019]|uniref:UvrD-helicase domain-containing protein n=1 Tax=Shewanella sp. KX20019 TaxID=2803864 RepID=UPI0019259D2D|nr:UvrD-helicase domain-containing protein [Shewanella sp. KX20019]QQX79775.1 UvrD-helicase domain-containing protein [Shewanella sp. KX20019]